MSIPTPSPASPPRIPGSAPGVVEPMHVVVMSNVSRKGVKQTPAPVPYVAPAVALACSPPSRTPPTSGSASSSSFAGSSSYSSTCTRAEIRSFMTTVQPTRSKTSGGAGMSMRVCVVADSIGNLRRGMVAHRRCRVRDECPALSSTHVVLHAHAKGTINPAMRAQDSHTSSTVHRALTAPCLVHTMPPVQYIAH